MTRVFAILLGTVLAVFGGNFAAQAEERPVLVELFTSQGCSSCPPADAVFAQIAQQPGIVALAFHVDYWDYIGWKDSFAQDLFSARQKLYARRNDETMIYTPQVIVQGQDLLVGSKSMDIANAIKHHSHQDFGLALNVIRKGGGVDIIVEGTPRDPSLTPDVFLVEFIPNERVEILRGENKGKTIEYSNIVRSISLVGTAQGQKWVHSVPSVGSSVAVFVQDRDQGPVLAAQMLR